MEKKIVDQKLLNLELDERLTSDEEYLGLLKDFYNLFDCTVIAKFINPSNNDVRFIIRSNNPSAKFYVVFKYFGSEFASAKFWSINYSLNSLVSRWKTNERDYYISNKEYNLILNDLCTLSSQYLYFEEK